MATVTHTFVDALPDLPADIAAGKVLPSHWNAVHTVTPLVSDGGEVVVSKNVDADNALNGDFRVAALAYDVNPISGRWNQVYRLGYNMSDTGPGYLAGEPSFGLHFESFYEQGGNEQVELHLSYFTTGGTEYRWESYSHDRAANTISHSSVFTTWNYLSTAGDQLVNHSASGTSLVSTFYGAASAQRVLNNNLQYFQQRNAAGNAYLSLPYIDSDDRIRGYCAVAFVGSTPGGTYNGDFAVFHATSAASGNVGIRMFFPDITGSYQPLHCRGSASTGMEAYLYNTNSSSATAHATFHGFVVGGSGGDPRSQYEVNGAGIWTTGLDNSDSDKFKISSGNALGTNDALSIDSNLLAVFAGPVKTLSTAFASLPAAGTAGAGARAFITDCNTTIFLAAAAGGGANAVPVVSNGTSWVVG